MSAHVVIGRRFGLLERSMVLLEQIQTIDQSAIDTHIGHIKDDKVMCRINAGLMRQELEKYEQLNKMDKGHCVFDFKIFDPE